MKHTPGPWEITGQNTIVAADGFTVASGDFVHSINLNWADLGLGHWAEKPGVGYVSRSDEEMAANAQLIAAAPDLLEAATALLQCLSDAEAQLSGYGYEAAAALDLAVKKVTGARVWDTAADEAEAEEESGEE